MNSTVTSDNYVNVRSLHLFDTIPSSSLNSILSVLSFVAVFQKAITKLEYVN